MITYQYHYYSHLIASCLDNTSKMVPSYNTSKMIPSYWCCKMAPSYNTSKMAPSYNTSKMVPEYQSVVNSATARDDAGDR